MAIAEWPATVPHYIVRGSFQLIAPSRPAHRTPFEDGPKRGRRSTTKNIATVGFDLSLTPAEFQAFVAFERDDLIDGTLPFTMPVLLAAQTYGVRTCRMAPAGDDGPAYRAAGGRGPFTAVSLVLDVEDWGA
jgi:hypothetical protein